MSHAEGCAPDHEHGHVAVMELGDGARAGRSAVHVEMAVHGMMTVGDRSRVQQSEVLAYGRFGAYACASSAGTADVVVVVATEEPQMQWFVVDATEKSAEQRKKHVLESMFASVSWTWTMTDCCPRLKSS